MDLGLALGLGVPAFGGGGVRFPSLANLALRIKFADIASLYQDSSATTRVASNDDPIGFATDLSGNSRNFLQATSGFKPTYKANVHNGKGAALFGSSDDEFLKYATGLAAASTSACTVYVISKPVSGATPRGILGIDAGADGGAFYYRYSDTLVPQCFDAEVGSFGGSSSAAVSSGVAGQTAVVVTGTQMHFRKDSSANGTIAAVGSFTKNTKILGAQADPFSPEYFEGHIFEVIVYYAVHTSAQWDQVEAYARSEYSIL